MYAYTVEPLYLESGHDLIAADFYKPINVKKPAVIVMAHGFAALRHFRLITFAQRFAQAGYAVVLFDYRHWGGSTGLPREMVSIQSQLDDWKSMVHYLASQKNINARKIILWGTSLSGGYVLTLASELKNIHAVIAQVPFVDGAETAKAYPLQFLPKALKLSSQDYMGAKVGMSPKTLPVVHPFSLCFLPTADSYEGYMSIVHPDYFWSGEVPARVFFNLIRFRPIQGVRNINIPVLLIAAKKDSLIPIESSRETATNIAPFVNYHEWNMSHFDIYHGQWLEKAISTQLEFLHQNIGVS
ncbi:alpha/beta hydrolase [Acinetobacter stercoris]|uniref:Alpha/beta hydrolase family protein n=1 Tax=Acinetobacter stercoris TaxID=2126983 RepID=A0A2U3MWJ9_9GAMM|nr:alpha/beta fold hydrolase [Acinetobacter stercoris]SPL69808.1 Alpha/beta hydrolase family protein [Acinetobacter stercoris]